MIDNLFIQVSDMVGGETEIRRGDGTTIKAMGPGIGNVSAIIHFC